MMKVYLHSPICFHAIVLNYIIKYRETLQYLCLLVVYKTSSCLALLAYCVQDVFQFGLTTIQTDVHNLHIVFYDYAEHTKWRRSCVSCVQVQYVYMHFLCTFSVAFVSVKFFFHHTFSVCAEILCNGNCNNSCNCPKSESLLTGFNAVSVKETIDIIHSAEISSVCWEME
jgi:hypothetical protein